MENPLPLRPSGSPKRWNHQSVLKRKEVEPGLLKNSWSAVALHQVEGGCFTWNKARCSTTSHLGHYVPRLVIFQVDQENTLSRLNKLPSSLPTLQTGVGNATTGRGMFHVELRRITQRSPEVVSTGGNNCGRSGLLAYRSRIGKSGRFPGTPTLRG